MFICKYCGKDFKPSYRIPKKKVLKFCSKTCATKQQRDSYRSKDKLEEDIVKVIKESGHYLTLDQIISRVGISSKTITKFKISIISINRRAGMKKPQSIFEHVTGEFLEEVIDDLEWQKTFAECRSGKGYPLKFDFYSKSFNLVVEADGDQHGNLDHVYSSEYTLECDSVKEDFLKREGVRLVRIPYVRKVTKEYIHKILEENNVNVFS